MSENNKKTKEFFSEKTNKDIYNSRIGGQVALSGFSYQMLSSCYLILTELNSETQFILEGIEDIDKIYSQDNTQIKTYTQIKYSKTKQDASFMKPILKNFLEVYLCDNSSKFRLIYDFSVAKGNMSKLFSTSLDEKALEYWRALILDIKNENNHWTWLNFNFENFIKVISFEKIGTNSLELEIEKNLIKKYKITTNNIPLYLNGLKIYCWKKMSNREEINQLQLDYLIHDIKDDISKGIQNPAHNWIQRINFKHDMSNDTSYYEGKKPTSQDISNELPIRRKKLEEQVKKSIFDNKVTVIKSSSGQGKTTLALQTAFNLKEEYSTYQLSWCNDEKELNNIIMYFESRIKLGEKLLILIDNLDFQLSGWNRLSQKMQEQISYHYKILITVRELDWYNYAGDISNLKMLNVIKIFLSKEDAKEIFLKLKHNKKLHKSISTWEKSWSKVKEKELLIEYVYLLTHGVMLSDRISEQIIQINKTEVGKIKCEILRILSIADICGVKLSIKNLLTQLVEVSQYDFGEILKSMESEFLIKKDDSEIYIEGLHPVRSQHISNRLHEFMEINDTVISVIKISDKNYLAKLFSNFPHLIKNKKNFYSEAVKLLFKSGLDSLILSLQGVFSGTVMKYYHENKSYFDDADNHSGLYLVVADSCPFTYFKEFDYKLETLSKLKKRFPTPNINYLCSIRDSMSKLILFETDIYIFSKTIFELMNKYDTSKFITELNLYTIVAEWLLNIDVNFNLTKKFTLNEIWDNAESYHLETISKIMYLYFCGNKEVFLKYTNQNLPMILTYLKKNTNSLELYISENMLEIHVKYILLPSNIKNSNEESVNRIKNICKTLPIFDFYCADSITPKINLLSEYNLPNDGHKKISLRNIFIMFHQEFASLWSDTIISNYVFDSNKEWLEFWFTVRKDIILFSQKSINVILKLLEGKNISHLTSEFNTLRFTISKNLGRHNGYPQQNKPFSEEKILPPNNFDDISEYFTSIKNFSDQILVVIEKKEKEAHLAIMNLNKGLEILEKMQEYFFDLTEKDLILHDEHKRLSFEEEKVLSTIEMTCLYYLNHLSTEFFKKDNVKIWYNQNYLNNMKKTEKSLNDLKTHHNIIYPQKFFYNNSLSKYPIIISDLDYNDATMVSNLYLKCIPFSENNFDYLIVALKNENEMILETGFKISKNDLLKLKNAFENMNMESFEKSFLFFPEIISKKFLDCFTTAFEIKKPEFNNYEGFQLIAELLWAYSKCRETLTAKNDLKYKEQLLINYKDKLFNRLKLYEHNIEKEVFQITYDLCTNVINGNSYKDDEYNDFILQLLSLNIKSI